MKSSHGFLILLIAAAGIFFLWNQETSTTAAQTLSQQETELLAAPTLAAAVLESEEDMAAESPPSMERVDTGPLEDGKTWIIRGFCAEPLPSAGRKAELRATLHAGHNEEAMILEEVFLKANAEGLFTWAIAPPEQTVYVYVRPKKTEELSGYGDGRRILLGQSPPQDLRVRFLTWDLPVHGSVLDVEGNPIADAEVSGLRPSTQTDAQGQFTGMTTSSNETALMTARAAGFVAQQQRLPIAGLADKVIEFRLQPGMNLAGLVVDINQVPLQGIEVNSFTQNAQAVYTDEAGRFRLDTIAPDAGSVMVYARGDDYAEASHRLETTGEDMTDIVLVMAAGAEVTGTVVLEDGTPVPDANVYLGFSPYAYDRKDAYTDERGFFRFTHVGEGDRTLMVEHLDFLPNKTDFQVPAGHNTVEQQHVILQRGLTVSGQVVDMEGQPMDKVWVSVAIGRTDMAQRPKTDAEGRFRLTGLPAEDVIVSLYMPGYGRLRHPLVAEDYQDSDFQLVMQQSGGFSGTVVDAVSGEGLDLFRIQLLHVSGLPASQSSVYAFSANWSAPGKTFRDTEGKWSASGEGFQPGAWIGVRVFAEGYVSQTLEKVLIPEDPEATPLRFTMSTGASLEGVVLPEAGGSPIIGATVTALQKGELDAWRDLKRNGYPQTETDAQGHFQMDGLPSGDLWLRVEHPSWPAKTVGPISMPESGSPTPQTILLDSGATLSGIVRGLDGMTVPGTEVTLIRQALKESPLLYTSTTTDLNGEYRFEHLADGVYDISVKRVPSLTNSVSMSLRTLLRDTQDLRVDFDATGTASVTGTLTWDGVLPKRIEVELSHPSRWNIDAFDLTPGSAIPMGYSAAVVDGKFHFPAVLPGTYDLNCMFQSPKDRTFRSAQIRPFEVLPDQDNKAALVVQ